MTAQPLVGDPRREGARQRAGIGEDITATLELFWLAPIDIWSIRA
jgi:hypothetical protein